LASDRANGPRRTCSAALAFALAFASAAIAGDAEQPDREVREAQRVFKSALRRALEVVQAERLPYQPESWKLVAEHEWNEWRFSFALHSGAGKRSDPSRYRVTIYEDGQVRIDRPQMPEPAIRREPEGQTARLDGRIRSYRGEGAHATEGISFTHLRPRVKRGTGPVVEARSDWNNKERTYQVERLEPGSHDIQLPRSYFAGERFAPELIHGVVLQAGSNRFDRSVNRGERLVISGRPRVNDPKELQRGWIEGTITDREGHPAWGAAGGLRGVTLRLKHQDGTIVIVVPSRLDLGGHYESRDLKPGTYTLELPATFLPDVRFPARRYPPVEIRAGVLTRLDLVVNRAGGPLPALTTTPVELNRPVPRTPSGS
jgi:hypothetical protein